MRLYYLLFGYVMFYIKEEERAAAANALLRRGITAGIGSDGYIKVPYIKCKKYKNALKSIAYEVIGTGGVLPAVISNRKRYGVFSGLILVLILYVITSFFVWDIRISGNEKTSDSVILKELADVGFEVGSIWNALSLNEVENDFLQNSDTAGWLNINRRGAVAYVTVKEKTVYEAQEKELAFSNVIASCDCIIEEITVRSGIACVKAGDTVKAGDLLISGVIPGELGGGFVRADGDIFGRVSEEISVEVPRCEMQITYETEELYEAKIKIFKFPINILKKYGKMENTCAIIEDVEECTLFGKYKIPIKVERIYVTKSAEKQITYSDSELFSLAASRLVNLRSRQLSNAELLKMRTEGGYTDSGYKMVSYVTVLRNIGETRYFGEIG